MHRSDQGTVYRYAGLKRAASRGGCKSTPVYKSKRYQEVERPYSRADCGYNYSIRFPGCACNIHELVLGTYVYGDHDLNFQKIPAL